MRSVREGHRPVGLRYHNEGVRGALDDKHKSFGACGRLLGGRSRG